MHTQTRTELTAVSLKATILWLNVGSCVVTGVVGHKYTQVRTHTHARAHTHFLCSCFSARQQSWKGTMGSNGIAVRTPYSASQSFLFLDLLLLNSTKTCILLFVHIFKFSIYTLFFFKQIFLWGFAVHSPILGGLCHWTWQWWGVKTFWFLQGTKKKKQLMAEPTENELKTL